MLTCHSRASQRHAIGRGSRKQRQAEDQQREQGESHVDERDRRSCSEGGGGGGYV